MLGGLMVVWRILTITYGVKEWLYLMEYLFSD